MNSRKKIAEINMVDYGSTGRIMFQIADCARNKGLSVNTYSMNWKRTSDQHENHHYYGNFVENGVHVFLSKLIGFHGCFSVFGTHQLVRMLKKYDPDIIHLHNLHNYSTNLDVLFSYIKKNNKRIIWTLHDTWAFTGHCMYFTLSGCDKWKTGCKNCQYLSNALPVDDSNYMWEKKKKIFDGLDMTIVTPSKWLEGLVKQSLLSNYPTIVINNGVDLSIFKPRKSNIKNQYKIPKENYLVLGVALGWGIRKGLDVFVRLSEKLGDNFTIVLVGTDNSTDAQLSPNIVSIHRTHSQCELADVYSAADVFVIPTREDNFPTTNIEALACGTPVITFETGGSPEIIDSTCGEVIPYQDENLLFESIIRVCEQHPFDSESCVKRAQIYNMHDRFNEYVQLYQKVIEEMK